MRTARELKAMIDTLKRFKDHTEEQKFAAVVLEKEIQDCKVLQDRLFAGTITIEEVPKVRKDRCRSKLVFKPAAPTMRMVQ